RARRLIGRWLPVALLPMAAWAIVVVVPTGKPAALVLLGIAVVGAIAGWRANRSGAEGWSFTWSGIFLLGGVSSIFVAVFPVVLPSTLDAAFDLTVANASSSPYTLGLMSVIAAFGIPLVLLYQGWTYWVFRRRVSEQHIPASHPVTPVV